ncbi:MAG: beta-N-acetylhexosaminidase [Bacilli bacterium]|jgi:beta-N-acetylhexosaminidase
MNLKEKLGQLLIIGFHGYEFNDHLKKMIREYKVANVILFARNIKSIKQLYELCQRIHKEVKEATNTIPLITIDQEGGMVTRIMEGATFCPGNMTLGATCIDDAYEIGRIMGEELLALGINMNLAPSLDVNNNPANPVIGVRSYGDNPTKVAQYGVSFINGIQEEGVIATAKHFPGHGDTNVDSHLGLPRITHSRKRIEEVELVPFKAAIDSGVKAIMSAHIDFKEYTVNNMPATLSKEVLTDLLRKELGFKGLIVSDCMEMKAIDDIYTTEKGTVMGIKAGLDLACISQTESKQIKALELLEKAVLNNEIPMDAIDAKVKRILDAKNEAIKSLNKHYYNFDFDYAKAKVDNFNHKRVAQRIVDESLTKVMGNSFELLDDSVIFAPTPFATTIAEDRLSSRNLVEVVKQELPKVKCFEMPLIMTDIEIEKLAEKASSAREVLVCTYNVKSFPSQAKLVNLLLEKGREVYVISFRNPYDILEMRNVKNYSCLYEYTPNSIRTLVKFLKKEIGTRGILPVKVF